MAGVGDAVAARCGDTRQQGCVTPWLCGVGTCDGRDTRWWDTQQWGRAMAGYMAVGLRGVGTCGSGGV